MLYKCNVYFFSREENIGLGISVRRAEKFWQTEEAYQQDSQKECQQRKKKFIKLKNITLMLLRDYAIFC